MYRVKLFTQSDHRARTQISVVSCCFITIAVCERSCCSKNNISTLCATPQDRAEAETADVDEPEQS